MEILEIKKTITKIKKKKLLDRIRSSMEMTKRRVSELKDRSIEILHAKQQREKRLEKN